MGTSLKIIEQRNADLQASVSTLSTQNEKNSEKLTEKEDDIIRKESTLLDYEKKYDESRKEFLELKQKNDTLELTQLEQNTSIALKEQEVVDSKKRLEYVN